MVDLSSNPGFVCKICGFRFFSKKDYDGHMFVFTEKKELHLKLLRYAHDTQDRIHLNPEIIQAYHARIRQLSDQKLKK